MTALIAVDPAKAQIVTDATLPPPDVEPNATSVSPPGASGTARWTLARRPERTWGALRYQPANYILPRSRTASTTDPAPESASPAATCATAGSMTRIRSRRPAEEQDHPILLAWADMREGRSRIYYRRSVDNGITWEGPPSGMACRSSEAPGRWSCQRLRPT